MKIIGITGGIGMGKSACSDWLVGAGYSVVDTDEIARNLTISDTKVIGEIRVKFGEKVFNRTGELDRAALARIVFSHPSQRKVLEMILHPRIRETWQMKIQMWEDQGVELGFVVIPLLYETKAEDCFDSIICVGCSFVTQDERLRQRGWDKAQIADRIASQIRIKDKMSRADHVIWTGGRMESTVQQLKMVLRDLG